MPGSQAHDRGFTLLELLFAAALAVLLMAMSAAVVARELEQYRTVGAVRYLATRLQRARMDAVARGANAAMRFTATGSGFAYAVYGDDNGDGVRSADIERGVDPQLLPRERLSDQFPGVDFGTLPGVPAVDGSTPPGSDPVRLGSARMASFTPLGTSSSGSLYILGPHASQFVIRLFGETGKTRILRFNVSTYQWEPL
jgi:prepilin-type N-terminal cleavage/methylation domain-containing protein